MIMLIVANFPQSKKHGNCGARQVIEFLSYENHLKKYMLPLIPLSLNRHFVWLGVLLIFLPKINLLSLGGETAGIRIDDFVLVWIAGLIFLFTIIANAWIDRISKIEKIAFWFIGAMVFSNFINILLYRQSSLLYSMRMLEYFVFFYIGIYFAERRDIRRVIWAILIANGIVIALQTLGLIGGFASEGYAPLLPRAIGLTGGPWEVGAVINICFAILVFHYRRMPAFVCYLFGLTMLLLLLTAARMPTVANIVLFGYYFYLRSNSKILFVVKMFFVAIPILTALVLIPNPVFERSANLVNLTNNMDVLASALDRVDPGPTDTIEQPDTEMIEDSDASWVMRAAKWAVAAKLYANTPSAWAWGVGPGHLGTSVDGGWLRLWCETGPIGVLLFISLFKQIAQTGWAARTMIIGVSISMVMIDIYMAYKVMALLFFVAGYMHYRQRNGAALCETGELPSTAWTIYSTPIKALR